MINRIVRLSFKPEEVQDFIKVFNQSKKQISDFPGCMSLSLYQDNELSNVFYTQSLWKQESDLEAYRASDLFKTTWAQTKKLFNDKPMAWSLALYDKVK